MFVWGLPVSRLVHTFSSQWGSYDVDTVTNLTALKHFGAVIGFVANDNDEEEAA